MRLGIDFGTTRIVVAASDRGNFPVAAFECPDGTAREWYAPLVAVRGAQRLYGWDAWAAQGEPGVTVVRSIKRCLSDAGPCSRVAIGPENEPMLNLLTGLVSALRRDLIERSSLHIAAGEPLEVLLGVPANANSNQRFLTAEAFRQSGFEVLGLMNEPSAAAVEYSHKLGEGKTPERILVYDLGGGTFDVSLVEREDRSHTVTATEGLSALGGDDFDEVLAELALDRAGRNRGELTGAQEFLLAEECREKKEALHPNTRRLVIDLDRVVDGWGEVVVTAAEFYERCEPMIAETLHASEDVLDRGSASDLILYVTGGGSELPLVSRLLRERFGRRVRRSAYTRSATAIGLAIQADEQSGYRLQERFSRFFGVWREANGGRSVVFDSLFDRGLALPGPGSLPLIRSREYEPVHNIGHFRYLECSHRGEHGEPVGDVTSWDDIRFPFDPSLAAFEDLSDRPVEYLRDQPIQKIEERYSADASGAVEVLILNHTSGYTRRFRLGRWAPSQLPVIPGASRRRRRTAR